MVEWLPGILVDEKSFESFKVGVVVGLFGGMILSGALTTLFIKHWAAKIYDRGVRDANKGWRGLSGNWNDL